MALAVATRDADLARAFLRKARTDFLAATSLCPPCVDAAHGLARAEAQLCLLPEVSPRDPSLDPMARFRRLLELRPHGVAYRSLFIDYLHAAGRADLLPEPVRRLAYAYPPAVRALSREPFWSPTLEAAARTGVRNALADAVLPRESRQLLSDFHADDGEWGLALEHHQAAMAIQPFRNGERDFLRLGGLQLRNGAAEAARAAFDHAFGMSRNRGATLRRVRAAYRRADRLLAFADYARSLNRFFVYAEAPVLLRAQALAEAGRAEAARALLARWGAENQSAAAHARLARLAGSERDWDAMERAAHKATVLDPRPAPHWLLLAEALRRQGKMERAESELSRAIQIQDPPSDRLHHHRAALRWRRRDFAGALADWRAAARIRPDHAGYRRHLERAAAEAEREASATRPKRERRSRSG